MQSLFLKRATKKRKEESSNYRAVLLTCISCKLPEQLVTTMDEIMKMVDNSITVHTTVLDFSKAFDKVPHNLLIDKLLRTNIDPNIIKWISNFLFHRFQLVVVDGVASTSLQVTSGVPQDSLLGPFLFLVYINDISDNLKLLTIKLFADNALMYCPEPD